MSVNVGTAIGYLDLDTSGFKRGFTSALADLNTFGDSTKSAETRISALGSAFTSAGSTLTKSLTLPIVGAGAAALTMATGFEKGMSEVQAIAGGTAEDLERLRAKALELGADTKFSAGEAAEGMKYMAQAGWDTEDMLNGMAGVMDLAAASGTDLAATSSIVADAITAFGMKASDSAHFADVMAMAANKTNTGVIELGESFKYVAPVAGALGYSLEDTSIALGLMANNGIKASQAGTSLRQVILGLQGGVELTGRSFGKWQIDVENADGTMVDFKTVLADLREGFSQMTEAEKVANAESIAGKIGMSGLLAIVNASDESFESLSEAMYNAGGAADEMASVMMDNLAGSLEELMGGLETFAITIGDILIPYIRELADWFQEIVAKLNSMSDSQKEQLVRILAIIAAIGPLLLIIGQLLKVISTVITIVKTVKTAVTALYAVMSANPIGIIIAAIGLLVAAFLYLWNTNEGFRNFWIGLWEKIKEVAGAVIQELVKFFTETLPSAFNSFISKVSDFKDSIVSKFTEIKESVVNKISEIITAIQDWFISIIDWFTSLPENVSEALTSVLTAIGEWGVKMYDNFTTFVREAIDSAMVFFDELPYRLGYALGYALQTIINWLTEMWQRITTEIPRLIESIVTWFSEMPGKVKRWLDAFIQNIITWLSEMREKITTSITTLISNIVQWFQELPGKVKVWLDTFIQNVISWLENMKEKITTGITTIIANIVQWFSELPGKIKTWLDAVITRVVEWISSMKERAEEVGSKFINTIVDWVKKLPDEFKKWFDNVISYLTGLPSKFLGFGKDIMNGLFDGIKAIGESLLSWFEGLWKKIMDFIDGIKGGMDDARDAEDLSKSIQSSLLNFSTNPSDAKPESPSDNNQPSVPQKVEKNYNFYSPVPITPVEARKQMVQAELEIALGFK